MGDNLVPNGLSRVSGALTPKSIQFEAVAMRSAAFPRSASMASPSLLGSRCRRQPRASFSSSSRRTPRPAPPSPRAFSKGRRGNPASYSPVSEPSGVRRFESIVCMAFVNGASASKPGDRRGAALPNASDGLTGLGGPGTDARSNV